MTDGRTRSLDDGAPDLTPAVIDAVERGGGAPCAGCRRKLCGHEVVMSFVLGFKDSLRCLPCLATGLSRAAAELRDHLREHVSHRECFSRGWQRASEIEGFAGSAAPGCLFPEGASGASAAATLASASSPSPSSSRATPAARSSAIPDGEWDAGDLGCGDLVLELRHRMNALRPGQTFKLIARDPGAPADLPAWCGLTGHVLLSARYPVYLIERRKE